MSNKIILIQDPEVKFPSKKYYLRVRNKNVEYLFPLEAKAFGSSAGQARELLDREMKLQEEKPGVQK